jgi:IS30 family transposase
LAYDTITACEAARKRRLTCANAPTIPASTWVVVEGMLRLFHSPQQICERLKREGKPSACTESIYQFVLKDKERAGDLVSFLRCQKARRKRYASGKQRRGQIKNRVGIDERPRIVDKRERVGDWEGDTVIGRGQSGVLVTLVERCSRFTLAHALPNKKADAVSDAIVDMLRPHRAQCHTMTFDNGLEFADHTFFGDCLHAKVYFAHPYHSWERGTNENTNGLLRQFFPKKKSFKGMSQADVDEAVFLLNHRPRKCLQWRTPHEVFFDINNTTLH